MWLQRYGNKFSDEYRLYLRKNNNPMHRKATQNDLQFIYDLYMHPQVNPFLLYEQMNIEEFKYIFDKLLENEIKYIFMDENGTSVGMFKLYPLTYRASHIAYLGGLAIHPTYAGKGFGLKMMQEIIDFANKQGYKRIELSAATENLGAIKLYKKVGFEEEGIMKKYTYLKRERRFLDELLMSYIKKE
jgi:L-phenylalanine/L-methionine N-acetyltransferase